MWMTIGFVALIGFSAIMIFHRYSAEWRGSKATHGDISYEYRVYSASGGRQIKVGMPTSRRYDFVIRRYSKVDRSLEHIGLVSDKVICNQAFDSSLLILSDDFLASQVLAGTPGLSDKILRVFDMGDDSGARVEKIVCRRGRLWALVEDHAQDGAHMRELADNALPVMVEFAEAMTRFQGVLSEQRTDRYAVPAVAMLLIALGFFSKGIIEWINAGTPMMSQEVLLQAIMFGGLVSVALAVVLLRFMRDGLRNHKMFAELFFISMLGAFVTIYADRAVQQPLDMVHVSAQTFDTQAVAYDG